MADQSLKVLQVSIADVLGGAEKMAWDLFRGYRRLGHTSWLAVGQKVGTDPGVAAIPRPASAWLRGWRAVQHGLEAAGRHGPLRWAAKPLAALAEGMAEPGRWWDRQHGYEEFRNPCTFRLLDLPPEPPDVIHCHNLHTGYFDLRALPWLSHQVPVVVSLHDAWLLSGLCCHSLGCDRWQTGCGQCPHLQTWLDPKRKRRDGTAHNWALKRSLYAQSQLYVTTACRWMMDKVRRSMLADGMIEARIIPYGVDLSLFRPAADRAALRQILDIPEDTFAFFYIGRGLDDNMSKDYLNLRRAATLLAQRWPEEQFLWFLRGAVAPHEKDGNLELRKLPWTQHFRDVARYYQAADIYVHASKADTFPLSVLEALACGTPIVASAVGGVPEQVKSLVPARGVDVPVYGPEEATGILVPPPESTPYSGREEDALELVQAIEHLLGNGSLRQRLGENGYRDARSRFGFLQQMQAYLDWYTEIVARAQRLPLPGSDDPPARLRERPLARCGS